MADSKAKKTTAKKESKTLIEQLADAQKDMLEARKSHKAGELVNPRIIGVIRKKIARTMTQINQEATKVKEGK